ncbi:alpha/beta fold hydrolase [Mycolicibacterium mengxianglii]|uniref:alpha/beta fold hydrolase n=1 Tax=Mycolicibacterium mengxianglii TaxID=2736649 RepID=UPI0018D01929|nr:alpha/beta hydrolase [Mycolicibacterium mengxianglii]
MTVHHRFADINGHRIFYREAGPADAPVLLLLHGFPSSSYMFRGLVPALADTFHVIAPDHLGFGLSDAPGVDEFDYTFDALTGLTAGLLEHLGISRYALYVHDYGAPIGWRLATAAPSAITAIISQSGNAYDAGFVTGFWAPIVAYQQQQNADTEAGVRQYFTLEATRWQYTNGVSDETLVNPESWYHDYNLISRPGNDAVQLKLFHDYATNAPMYPALHEYFRSSQVPLLAVWGRGDGIFGPDGATAFAEDLPNAEIHLLDGGHFLLESALDDVTNLIRSFLGKLPVSG